MSFVSFLFRGLEGKQKDYRRDQYSKDGEQFLYYQKAKQLDTFEGKITQLRIEGDLKYVTVEDAFQFTILNDEIRNQCDHLWHRLKSNSARTCLITGAMGVVGLTAAFLTPLIPVAILIGVISLGILIFAPVAFYRYKQATGQMKLWQDPTESYIQRCHQEYKSLRDSEIQRQQLEKRQEELMRRHMERANEMIQEHIQTIRKCDSELAILKTIDVTQEANWDEFRRKSSQIFLKKISDLDIQISNLQKQFEMMEDQDQQKKIKQELEKKQQAKTNIEEAKQTEHEDSIKECERHTLNKIENSKEWRLTWINQIDVTLKFYINTYDLSPKLYDILKPYCTEIPELKAFLLKP